VIVSPEPSEPSEVRKLRSIETVFSIFPNREQHAFRFGTIPAIGHSVFVPSLKLSFKILRRFLDFQIPIDGAQFVYRVEVLNEVKWIYDFPINS
jgi:hypothetical protein